MALWSSQTSQQPNIRAEPLRKSALLASRHPRSSRRMPSPRPGRFGQRRATAAYWSGTRPTRLWWASCEFRP